MQHFWQIDKLKTITLKQQIHLTLTKNNQIYSLKKILHNPLINLQSIENHCFIADSINKILLVERYLFLNPFNFPNSSFTASMNDHECSTVQPYHPKKLKLRSANIIMELHHLRSIPRSHYASINAMTGSALTTAN